MKPLEARLLPHHFGVAGAALFSLGLAAMPAARALDVRPSVRVGAVYSDNLFLTPDNKFDDVVTRIDPRIDITHVSERVDLNVAYTYSYLKYAKADNADTSFTEGRAALDLALIKDALALESVLESTRQLIDPESGFSYTNVPVVDNRINETRIETSPHLDTEIFGLGVDARYVVGRVTYSADVSDVDYQETHTAITTRDRPKGLSVGLFHNYAVYSYQSPPDNKTQDAYITLTYGLRDAADFFLFGSFGLENDYRDFTSGSLKDNYWEAGFRRTTGRTLVEAAVGDRSFGSTFRGRIRRELNAGSIELAYREDPSVQEQLFERRPKIVTPGTPATPDVPSGIDRPGSGARFVYKLASATFVKIFGSNTLELVGFHQERDDILDRTTTPPDVVQNSETEAGGTARLTRVLGRRTTVGLEGELSNRWFRSGNSDQINVIRARGTYAFGRKLSLEGYLGRFQQQGSDIPADNYEEFQAGLFANYNFR
ncbi:MAG: hypothetical protein ABI567_02470 [Gammaproteobacteria bacterium]